MSFADFKDKDAVLILQEVPMHPRTVLKRLEDCFERPSIVRMSKKEGLKHYNKPPVYDSKYLVLFEDKRIFESCIGMIQFKFMLPVVVCPNKNSTAEVKELCRDKKTPFVVYVNEFKNEDAEDFVRELASVEVTSEFCKTLRRRVGLNPQRIVSAVMVCEQVGYSVSNISKYVDKYIYIDIYDVIESLLKIYRSGAQMRRAALYLHMNRNWYSKYTRDNLVNEVSSIIQIYRDLLSGELTIYSVSDYALKAKISRYRILYTISLLERVSLYELLTLKSFLERASLLEVAMHLG